MLKIAVLVSGGGTNLQAILDAIDAGTIRNAKVEVVISNNAGAFALERAKKHGIPAECLSPKEFASREEFNEALVAKIDSYHLDLIVLAGYLVKIPAAMIEKYRDKIINIHPSLIDPVLLRCRLLRTEGPRGCARERRKDHRCDGAFCG